MSLQKYKIFFVISMLVCMGCASLKTSERTLLSPENATSPSPEQEVKKNEPSNVIIINENKRSGLEGWKLWENKKLGFRLKLPPGLYLDDSGDIRDEKVNYGQEVAGFMYVHVDSNSTLEGYKKVNETDTHNERYQDIKINGVPGIKFFASSPFSPKCPNYVLSVPGKIYHISLYECKNVDDFDKIVETFHVL